MRQSQGQQVSGQGRNVKPANQAIHQKQQAHKEGNNAQNRRHDGADYDKRGSRVDGVKMKQGYEDRGGEGRSKEISGGGRGKMSAPEHQQRRDGQSSKVSGENGRDESRAQKTVDSKPVARRMQAVETELKPGL